jgi:hypothetical protein
MPPKKQKPPAVEPWKTSRAKELLYDDIKKGIVTYDLAPELVYGMHLQYQQYTFDKFKTYFDSLMDRMDVLRARADSDSAALANDILIRSPSDALMWDGSDAKKQLQEDIAAGVVGTDAKPEQVWSSRPVYGAFPLKKFRGHLYQERRPKGSGYWYDKMKSKKKKRSGDDDEEEEEE